MKTIDQIITANSLSSIDALREANEFCTHRGETENQNKTFNQLMLDFLNVKFPDFFVKKTKTPNADVGNRGKANFKQPTLLWLAIGENAKLPINDALAAWRTEKPELSECPDQTFRDYFNRFNKKGLRATESTTVVEKSSPKTKKQPAGPVIAVIPEEVEETVSAVEPPVVVAPVVEVEKPKVMVSEETQKVKLLTKSVPPAKKVEPAKKVVKK
jgi:hypothetical protein